MLWHGSVLAVVVLVVREKVPGEGLSVENVTLYHTSTRFSFSVRMSTGCGSIPARVSRPLKGLSNCNLLTPPSPQMIILSKNPCTLTAYWKMNPCSSLIFEFYQRREDGHISQTKGLPISCRLLYLQDQIQQVNKKCQHKTCIMLIFFMAAQGSRTARNMRINFKVVSNWRRKELEKFAMPAFCWSKGGRNCPRIPNGTGPMWWTPGLGPGGKVLSNRRRRRNKTLRNSTKSGKKCTKRKVPGQRRTWAWLVLRVQCCTRRPSQIVEVRGRGKFYPEPDYWQIMICRIYCISKTARESIIRLLRLLLLEKVGN